MLLFPLPGFWPTWLQKAQEEEWFHVERGKAWILLKASTAYGTTGWLVYSEATKEAGLIEDEVFQKEYAKVNAHTKYRKKPLPPIEIEAYQWDGTVAGGEQIKNLFGARKSIWVGELESFPPIPYMKVLTMQGQEFVIPGDYVIREATGFSVCRPDVFKATYEAVEEPTPVIAEPENSCNLHNDCHAANVKAQEAGKPFAKHCTDDCCEDCFGS